LQADQHVTRRKCKFVALCGKVLAGVNKCKVRQYGLLSITVEPPHSAVNMTLPAFSAGHRHLQHGACTYRPVSPARRALSSKPAGRRCCCRSTGQTGGRTSLIIIA